MREARRVILFVTALVAATVGTLLMTSGGAVSVAKEKPKRPAAASADKSAAPAGPPVNACGCYKNDRGGCICTDKKGKCECPGECEPVGCDLKREKEMEREMAAEVKRAQEDDRKRKAAEEAQERGIAADAGIVSDEPAQKPQEKPAAKPARATKPAKPAK
jgi:hypothetical protein